MDSERTGATAGGTVDSRVDMAIEGLDVLGDLPLDEHPAALEEVHDRLREILGELGEPGRPGRPGSPGEQGEQGELGRR